MLEGGTAAVTRLLFRLGVWVAESLEGWNQLDSQVGEGGGDEWSLLWRLWGRESGAEGLLPASWGPIPAPPAPHQPLHGLGLFSPSSRSFSSRPLAPEMAFKPLT